MVTSQSKRRRWSPARHWVLLLCDQTWPSKKRKEETRERERGKKARGAYLPTIRLPYAHITFLLLLLRFSTESHHPPYRQVHLVSLLLLHSNIRHSQWERDTPWEKPCLGGGGGGGKLLSPTTRLAGSRAALQAILTLWQPAIHIPSIFFSPMPTQVHCVQTWLWRGEGKEREIQWDGRAGLPNRRPQQKDSSSKLRVENCQTLLRVIIYFYFSSCSRRSDVQYIYICIYCLCAPHIPRVVIDCDGCPGLSRCGDWWRHDARQPRPAAVGVHCTVPTIFNFIFFLLLPWQLFFFFFSHFNSRMSIFV